MNRYQGKGLAFAKRIYAPRTVGVSVGFLTVAASLFHLNAPQWLWVLAFFNALIWPHIAYWLARTSRQPYKAEWRNLLTDSFGGGFWIGAMGFSVLPAITVVAMMAMHNIAAAGPRLMFRGFVAQAAGIMVSLLVLDPVINLESTPMQMYACLPVLVIYPIFIGWMSHQVTLKLREHRNILHRLSRTDSLTGLLNHGAWKELLDIEFAKSRSLNQECVVALFDIDFFKTINDTYGHLVGDTVLQSISQAMVDNLRKNDVTGRCGGDEFCVILPGANTAQARKVLEKLRLVIDDLTYSLHEDLKVSLSIGVAAYNHGLNDTSAWLHEADKALYLAKSTGRNRVVIADDIRADCQDLSVQT